MLLVLVVKTECETIIKILFFFRGYYYPKAVLIVLDLIEVYICASFCWIAAGLCYQVNC